MTIKEKITELFENNKGVYMSGEDIAERLRVTRSAVWKAVKALQDEGYEISAVTNKGYCLSESTDVLSATGIKKYLATELSYLDLKIYKTVHSTNAILQEIAIEGGKHGCVVLSSAQTGGRGRFGRSFYSPSDKGIYMSILLRPDMNADKATLITTAAAVAVCEAIEKVSNLKPQIKWVNDIYIEGRKVCGILTEASFSMESGRIEHAVLGIGVNVYCPQDGFPDEIKNIAGYIFEDRRNDARNRLVAEILNCFMRRYSVLAQNSFMHEYKKRSLVIGRKITVLSANKTESAVALDIDESCHLLVRYEDGREEYLSSGEISIKL